VQWMRKASENDNTESCLRHTESCLRLAKYMYFDLPYAREVGHVEDAAGVAASIGDMGVIHDVPRDVLASVVHWLRKGGYTLVTELAKFRNEAVEGAMYCRNEGCEVVGLLKDFKVCPQCKTTRYCGDECQREDWTTGGHKAACHTV